MNHEMASYIINFFSNLLNTNEKLALKHARSTYKLEDSKESDPKLVEIYRKFGWLSSEESVLELLKNGYVEFEMLVAKRILETYPEKVFLNNCEQCGKLARTPFAKQCRHCGYDWH